MEKKIMPARLFVSKKFLAVFIFLIFLAVLASNINYFNSRYAFIDQTFHFLGGAWTAVLFLNIFYRRRQWFDIQSNWLITILFSLGITALAGIGWEFFEYLFWLLFNDPWLESINWGLDTINDLFMDLAGSATFLWLAFISRCSLNKE